MNIDNGHLVKLMSDEAANLFAEKVKQRDLEKRKIFLSKMEEAKEDIEKQSYIPIPEELNVAAEKKLAGKDEAYVSLTSGGKLSKWAAKQRAKQRKAKRKMQKESRRKNW